MNARAENASDAPSPALLAELRPALVAYFQRRCANTPEAEDLAHEVIARALAHEIHDATRTNEQARGYIFTIAANLWRDRGRRQLTRGTHVELSDETEELTTERVVEAEHQLKRIVKALNELPERTRDVFVLHRLEGMKQTEIAELLGLSVSSIEKYIAKALEHIAECLDKDDKPHKDEPP